MSNVRKLIEMEIIALQERIKILEKEGCDHCGYLSRNALSALEEEKKLDKLVSEYELHLSTMEG